MTIPVRLLLAAVLTAGTLAGCASSGGRTDGTATGTRATGPASEAEPPTAGPGGIGVFASVLTGASAPGSASTGSPEPYPEPAKPSTGWSGSVAPAEPAVTASRVITTGFTQVSTPSGNIGCALSEASVRCDIQNRTWPDPQKPAGCEGDYGSSVSLTGSGAGRLACVTDTVAGSSDVIGYGTGVRYGSFWLISSQAGVYCRNLDSGHGFFLAKERFVLF